MNPWIILVWGIVSINLVVIASAFIRYFNHKHIEDEDIWQFY